MMSKARKMSSPKGNAAPLPVLRPNVAGIDVGSREHWVAAPQNEPNKPNVCVFRTTTAGLNDLADWLLSQGVESVAMESTSVYWIPMYELLESRGLEVLLVNAHQLRNVPGRKTDMHDCQWIQVLHSCGLLRGSFRPPEEIARVRALHRQMTNLIQQRARMIQWMQKALDQMNVQVHRAVTDLTGTTGMLIVRAIVAGERDPHKLAAHRNHRCRKSEAEIAEYLTGTWREEHLFNLASTLRMFDMLEGEIASYEHQINDEIKRFLPPDHDDDPVPPHPNSAKEKAIKRQGKEPRRDLLYHAAGVDLTRIDGIGVDAATTIINELGTSLSAFPTESHFVSWLKLCPKTSMSGGKSLKKKRKRPMGANRVAIVLRLAASALGRSKSALGAYYRSISRRKDGATAIFATARKLACYVYRMLRYGQDYVDIGEEAYNNSFNLRRINALHANARQLGYTLTPVTEG